MQFGDYFREIYARGLGGERPAIPVSIGGAGACRGGGDGGALGRLRLRRGGRRGHDARQPGGIPPLADPAADDARRRRARPLGRPSPEPRCPRRWPWRRSASSRSSIADGESPPPGPPPTSASRWSPAPPPATTLEEIAEANGDGPRWFQLYWPNDDEIAASFVRRAEAAGYGAIVLTVDTFIPGWKPRDLQQAWLPFLEGIGNANFFQDPVFRCQLEQTPEEDPGAATGHYLAGLRQPLAHLGAAHLAARDHLAADPPQGDPPSR